MRIATRLLWKLLAAVTSVTTAVAGCGFHGVNSLPLPGTAGHEPGSSIFHVAIANIGTLESNSPVMIGDVIVGSIGEMRLRDWHADIEIHIAPSVVVPANAVATVGQTSLLGSQHLALDPPLGQPPAGRLQPGATIPLSRSSTYPSTEQTLSALSVVVNAGGLGQIGDIIHNFNAALSGRQDQIRDLLTRLDRFVGMLTDQRDNIIGLMRQLNQLAETFAGQRATITHALRTIPAALAVLSREEPRLSAALSKLGTLSDTATTLVHDAQSDLVKNLQNLEPTIRSLADVGPELDAAIAFATVFPYGQNLLDRGVRGDYFNLFEIIDITVPRLKRGLMLGTRWGQEGLELVPAPGDPGYDQYYTRHPLSVGIDPPAQHDATSCVLTSWTCAYPTDGVGPAGPATPTPAPGTSPGGG